MRIATWNINGLRARLDFLLDWLRERRPDVVGLQELKAPDEQFPHEALAAAGYRAAVLGQKGWNGVALLARASLALEVTQRGLPGQELLGARLLSAEIGGGAERLAVTTVYVPNGKFVGHLDFAAKLAWLDALTAHLAERHRPERPLVVCGDFNVVPAPLDSWNEAALRGAIFHTDEERARFAALLGWGLRDLFRERNPDLQAFSWWDYRGGAFHRRQGLRIDFLLATPPLAARAGEVAIDREWRKKRGERVASDHAPVVADLGAA